MIEPNIDEAIAFLQQWSPARPWVLTAINPAGKGIVTTGFDGAQRCRNAIATWSGRGWNVYFQVNPDRREPGAITSKAGKTDIAMVVALQADVDPYKGEDPDQGRKRMLHMLQHNLPEGVPGPPTVIILSGNGFNVLWRLRAPVVLQGPKDIEAVEARNRWLQQAFGGDATTDVCRVMRLPGSINYPNERKRARGLVSVMSRLVLFDDGRVYDLEAFPTLTRSCERADGDGWRDLEIEEVDEADVEALPDRLREIVMTGSTEKGKRPADTSRSGWAFYAALLLVRLGWPPERIVGLMLIGPWGVQDRPDPEREAKRTVWRAMKMVDRWSEAERKRFDDLFESWAPERLDFGSWEPQAEALDFSSWEPERLDFGGNDGQGD